MRQCGFWYHACGFYNSFPTHSFRHYLRHVFRFSPSLNITQHNSDSQCHETQRVKVYVHTARSYQ